MTINNDDRTRRRCPYCGDQTFMEYVQDTATVTNWTEHRVEALFQCAGCDRYVIGGGLNLDLLDPSQPNPRLRAYTLHPGARPDQIAELLVGRVQYWEPTGPVGKSYADVPPEIATAADEAYRCFSIDAYRAAVLMARATIEAVSKHVGITTGQLVAKIDALEEAGHIRAVVRESAHEVRHLGNDMAHGDFATTTLDRSDAEDVLDIMDDVIDEVLQIPARAARRKQKREARQ